MLDMRDFEKFGYALMQVFNARFKVLL